MKTTAISTLLAIAVLATTHFFTSNLRGQSEDQPLKEIVVSGSWGEMKIKPRYNTIYTTEDRGIIQFTKAAFDARTPVSICDITVFDQNGNRILPIESGPTFLIQGKPEKVSLKSSNPRAISVVNGTECLFNETGKSVFTLKFGKQTAKFTVNVVRTKIALGMKPSQVLKITGKPSLRIRSVEEKSRLLGATTIAVPENHLIETWRWERQPELEVKFDHDSGSSVCSVKSELFPSDHEIEQLGDNLLEDLRTPKGKLVPRQPSRK